MPYTDQEIKDYATQLDEKGASFEEIDEFVKLAKEEQVKEAPQPTAPKPVEKRFIEEASEEVGGTVLGALKGGGKALVRGSEAIQKGMAKGLGFLGMTGAQKSIEEGIGQAQPFIQRAEEKLTERRKEIGASETSEKVGEFVGEVGLEALLTRKISPTKIPKTVKALAEFLPKSLATTSIVDLLSKGELPSAESGFEGFVIDLAAPIAGKALEQGRGFIGQTILKRTPKQLGQDLKRGQNLGIAITEKIGPTLTRKGLITKLEKEVTKASDKLDNLIKQADTGFKPVGAETLAKKDDIIKFINESDPSVFSGIGREELERVEAKIVDKVNGFLDKNKGLLGLEEIQAGKKTLGKGLQKKSFFQKLFSTPDKVINAGDLAVDAIRKNLQTAIETNVKGAKELNQFMSPLLESISTLKGKGNFSGLLLDSLFGLAYSEGLDEAVTDPTKFIKGFATGVLIRRGLANTAVKTTGATMLRESEKLINSTFGKVVGRKALSKEEKKP